MHGTKKRLIRQNSSLWNNGPREWVNNNPRKNHHTHWIHDILHMVVFIKPLHNLSLKLSRRFCERS